MTHNYDMSCFHKNTLIVYYTRNGHCEKIAQYLADFLHCDLDKLSDKHDYSGAQGLALCAAKAVFRRPTTLKATRYDPEFYDDVILVSPIWAGKTCPAIRTYVAGHADKLKCVHLVTCGGLSSKKGVRRELSHDYGIDLNRTLGVTIDDVESDIFKHHVRKFLDPEYVSPDLSETEENTDASQSRPDVNAAQSPSNGVKSSHTERGCGCIKKQPSQKSHVLGRTFEFGEAVPNEETDRNQTPNRTMTAAELLDEANNADTVFHGPYGRNPHCAYPANSPNQNKTEQKMSKNASANQNNNASEKQSRNTKACSNQEEKSTSAKACSNKANNSAEAKNAQSGSRQKSAQQQNSNSSTRSKSGAAKNSK